MSFGAPTDMDKRVAPCVRCRIPRWDPRDPGSSGGPLHEPYVNRHLRVVLERAGLPRVTLYQLRHTGATVMLALGVPLEQIQEVMGHTSINTTRRYAALGDSLRTATADKMGAWLRETAHMPLGGTTGGTSAEASKPARRRGRNTLAIQRDSAG